MGWTSSKVVPWGRSVTSCTDIVWAVEFEVGAATAGVAGKESGVGTTTGGVSDGGRDGSRQGGSSDGRSTLHKGSRDPGSKSRKATEGGVSDVKGRSAGVVTWRRRRSIAIGKVRSHTISSWRQRGKCYASQQTYVKVNDTYSEGGTHEETLHPQSKARVMNERRGDKVTI